MRKIGILLPWVLLIIVFLFYYTEHYARKEHDAINNSLTLAQGVVALGKLELVKYKFQEINEIRKISPAYFNFLKLEPDSKVVLISQGEAVGCVDLTHITEDDITLSDSTVTIVLPEPELCYFKLDLQNTRIYAVESGLFSDRKELIEDAYAQSEIMIRESAYESGILEESRKMAQLIIRPFLERITNRKVKLVFKSDRELNIFQN